MSILASNFNRTCFRTVQTCPSSIYLFICTHLSCIYRGCMFLKECTKCLFLYFFYMFTSRLKVSGWVQNKKKTAALSFVKVDIYWTDLHARRINKIAILGTQNDFKFTFITSGHFGPGCFPLALPNCATTNKRHFYEVYTGRSVGTTEQGTEGQSHRKYTRGCRVCRETSKCPHSPPHPTPPGERTIHCAGLNTAGQ